MIEGSEVDARVTRVVKILLGATGQKHGELADSIGLTRSSMSRLLAEGKAQREWRARDIRALAVHFGVDEQLFFAPDDKNVYAFLAASDDLKSKDGPRH